MQAHTGFLAGIQPLRFTHRVDLLSVAASYHKELYVSSDK
jgi:hypothetical protein